MSDPGTVLVLAAGDPGLVVAPPPHDMVIAADSGLDLAESLGIGVDLIVGDMDSVSSPALARAEKLGVPMQRHPRAKDRTDLELAMKAAVAAGASAVHVIVGSGGRVDHAVANLAVLASPDWSDLTVTATVGGSRVWVVRSPVEIPLPVGAPLSLVAFGGPATGVHTIGLEWRVHGETLDPYRARGVSNTVVSLPVSVSVESGVLLAISSPTPSIDHGAVRG